MTGVFKIFLFLLTSTLAISCTRPPLPPPIVLFDQAHGQQSLIENTDLFGLSDLAENFKQHTFDVQSSREPLTDQSLNNVAVLVISGARTPLSGQEIQALHTYLNKGGQLCLLLDAKETLSPLLQSLNIAVSNGLIHAQTSPAAPEAQTDFFVTDLAPHPLTKGLRQFKLSSSWALNTSLEANSIAKTGPQTWIDLNGNNARDGNDAQQAFSVVVTGQLGHGHFVLFADSTIFQNRSFRSHNQKLAENLSSWFKKGSYYTRNSH